jgi:biopolymer transport protein TolQ
MPLLLATGTSSAWSLIVNADPVVKAVMLVLICFSLISWAIILQRVLVLRKAWSQSSAFLERFWNTTSLEQANQEVGRYPDSPVALAFAAGYRELVKLNEAATASGKPTLGATENVGRSLRKAASEQMTRLERTIPFLASVGSSAPFIGLFGTVWGILRAFQEIGARGTTSIAEVGPFIAEALIATAVGLFAAIPAVLFFNYFATRLKILAREVNHFSADFLNLVERHERSKSA